MNSTPQLDYFVKVITGNASTVLGTITNETLVFKQDKVDAFDFNKISANLDVPLVLITINFTGDQNFQALLGFSTRTVSALADLMMLGDGSAEYNEEEHNEATQEMFNQILGAVNSEFAAEGISLNGTVASVETTDMDLQQDLMGDNTMVAVTMQLLEQVHTFYMFIDMMMDTSMLNVYNQIKQNGGGIEEAPKSNGGGAEGERTSMQAKEQPPVPVSKATFSDISEQRSKFNFNSVNVDLLMDIVLPITVELGRKSMRIKEILEMGQGSVVELDKLAGDFVDILVNGQKFAVGEIMVVDENFAIRIVNLISREDRIRSLGK